MDLDSFDRKKIGNFGESIAAEYLKRHGFGICDRNRRYKVGELDIVVKKGSTLHIIEVKTLICKEFPHFNKEKDLYNPAENLHAHKLKKVSRATEWYCAERKWSGEVQIDGILVWLRREDGMAYVQYIPQIL